MSDLLVKLYDLEYDAEIYNSLKKNDIYIKRPLSLDREKVLQFVRQNFNDYWVNECKSAFANNPITCYIAVKEKKIIGFACYDATAKNFFGPTGVKESERGKNIGEALLKSCMHSMEELGYGYAIIGGGEGAFGFYSKKVGATIIEGSSTGIYGRVVDND